jgi:hypothetical protein
MIAPDSDKPKEWVQVAEVGQLWQGELIVGRLRSGGIEAEILDQTFHQEPMPNVRALALVRVLVPLERADEARRLLSQAAETPDDSIQ